jgi:hypothetical protein
LEKAVVESKSMHHIIGYTCKAGTHKGFINLLPREGVNSFVWKQVDDDTIIYSAKTTTHPNRPNRDDRVRVEMPIIAKITQFSQGRCKLTHCHSLSAGQFVPKKILDHYIKRNLQITEQVQQYFQQLRPLELLNKIDGVAMAEAFGMEYSKREKTESKESKRSRAFIRVRAVIASHKALKQYGEENIWFNNLMTGVVANKLGLGGSVKSKLLVLSEKEARTIGNSLAALLISNTQSDLAVDEWILTFPATKELDKKLVWFRPMINRIAMRLLARALLGAKFRLFFGAGLSILDLLTDIQTIVRFLNQGKNGFAKASAAFIGMSLLLQLLAAFGQNRKRGKKVVAYEWLIILSMIKPAMDAKRVADGNIQEENTVLNPQL